MPQTCSLLEWELFLAKAKSFRSDEWSHTRLWGSLLLLRASFYTLCGREHWAASQTHNIAQGSIPSLSPFSTDRTRPQGHNEKWQLNKPWHLLCILPLQFMNRVVNIMKEIAKILIKLWYYPFSIDLIWNTATVTVKTGRENSLSSYAFGCQVNSMHLAPWVFQSINILETNPRSLVLFIHFLLGLMHFAHAALKWFALEGIVLWRLLLAKLI